MEKDTDGGAALCCRRNGRAGTRSTFHFDDGRDSLGRDGARLLWDSMRWAAAEVRKLPARHGFDIGYRPGSLWAAGRPRRVAMCAQARDEAAERRGYDRLRVIGRHERSEWPGGTRYLTRFHDPESGHLNPQKLALRPGQCLI
ncbi:FAD dependent oxidoreductase [Burkholderia aenigmatica]|uniref:FAD dependent oxidoreductase n=1 Tax=Burkholderia aenigmatica TaxID=2015348 RepID=A0A6P2JSV2_9BURK|nr:FAD dependent oxidoreductase [Burkholderia aenigmatica]